MKTAVFIVLTSLMTVFATQVVRYESNDTYEIKTEITEKTTENKTNLKDFKK